MPEYNTRAQLAWGLGRYWFDDMRTIAQECNTLRPGCVVALSDGTIVWDTGTVQLRANGHGLWACVPYPADGYVDALGRTLPPGQDTPYRPDTIGPDGAVCLRPFSNAFADVLELTGEMWRLSDADAFDVQLLGDRRAIWREIGPGSQTLHSVGLSPAPATPDGEYYAARLIAKPDGTWGLLYQSGTGGALVFDGRIVADGVAFFRPDATFVGDVLHVAWALDQSEAFGPEVTFTPAQFAALPLIADRLHPAPIPPDPVPPDPEPEPPDPEPTPEPPDPEPVPESPYISINEDAMTTEQGWLIGPGDRVASVHADGRVTFDHTDLTDVDLLELTQPDDRYGFRHLASSLWLGADATKETPTGDVCRQFYAIPERRGNYEMWSVGQWAGSPIVSAVIFYDRQGADNGRPWTSAALTWVKK